FKCFRFKFADFFFRRSLGPLRQRQQGEQPQKKSSVRTRNQNNGGGAVGTSGFSETEEAFVRTSLSLVTGT
ncbi:MAG: hypothetical protein EBZ13_09930, partial [Planctomycetia bacterium]|nr:hypothetical protein [Planctomycetia bacterium]